jgi:hypothetical protein
MCSGAGLLSKWQDSHVHKRGHTRPMMKQARAVQMPTTVMTASVDMPLVGGWIEPVVGGTGMVFGFVCGRHLGRCVCANSMEMGN